MNVDIAIVEEMEDNARTGVEQEDLGDSIVERPWDASKIRVDPKTFSLKNILDLINDKELDLAPDFQRRSVWKSKQRCRLIESIFLRIPLPAFYFSSADDGLMQVVDGVQRLTTIRDFASEENGFVLHEKELEYLGTEVGGKSYKQLVGSLWLRRFNSTQVIANVIDPQTPDRVKFDIFKRINTGGSPLNAQEIRHCMSKQRSRDFLIRCTELESFQSATGGSLRNHVRMADREVALRFCAFQMLGVDAYSERATMDDFLTDATRRLDKELSDASLDSLLMQLDTAMTNADLLFGRHAFRKWPVDTDAINPLNRALFETWSVTLARYTAQQLTGYRDEIVVKAREMMTTDAGFIDAITTGTGDPNKVGRRFKKIRDLMTGVVG